MENVTKIEHVLKGWEKKYGYLAFPRSFFSPIIDKPFTLNLLGKKLYERKFAAKQGRIYVSRDALKDLQVGDVLLCYRDREGNYHIEKTR